ncbi:MAG: ATP-binding cassette domain-containing protein, partial [Oscillospiraceae bacterium]|nr:ATP-binding cassette domain-containing protein [Oscillospiraceae bacterium]
MSDIIKTEDLTFAYLPEEGQEKVPALQGVDLSIEQGSFVVILGHNGSGKSTLAKHMNAVLIPEGGTVWVDGMDTRDEDLLLEVRRRVGMVFQNPDNQIVANVVEEDVAFGPENLGVPTEEI